MTGWGDGECLDQSPLFLTGPETSRKVLQKLHGYLSEPNEFAEELLAYRKDNSKFWMIWSAEPIKEGNNGDVIWVSVHRKASSPLYPSSSANSTSSDAHPSFESISSRLIHRLRNQIAVVEIGLKRSRKLAATSNSQALEAGLAEVEDQVHELTRTLTEFRSSGAPVSSAIREACERCRAIYGGKEFSLELLQDLSSERVSIGAARLQEVVLSVLKRAVEARADSISITSSDDSEGITVRVIDNGLGIPNSDTTLVLASTILQEEGGDIILESDENSGTIVTLRVPKRADT